MKILFLSHAYKEKHEWLIKGILEVFKRHNYSVDYELYESVSYDFIFAFNRIALKKYEKIPQKKQVPVIYSFCLSDIVEEYIITNVVTQTIIIKDKVIRINHLSNTMALYQDMIFPSCIKSGLTFHKERPLIYIRIEDDYLGELTFLKLLRLLNQMDNYTIYYQSDHAISRYYINPHIKIITCKHDIREEIDMADIVIGSGMIAAFAVQQEKKTIVIGERGYGGLVTNENLEYHISNCFQGRNGGKLDEFIPLHLVENAIKTDEINIPKTMEKLSLLQAQCEDRFIKRIEQIVLISGRICLNDSTLLYRFSPDFDIIKKKKRFWLCKQIFRTLYKSVNESESAVIWAFQHPYSIMEVLSKFPQEYEEDIMEYIQELITEKILIPTESLSENNTFV